MHKKYQKNLCMTLIAFFSILCCFLTINQATLADGISTKETLSGFQSLTTTVSDSTILNVGGTGSPNDVAEAIRLSGSDPSSVKNLTIIGANIELAGFYEITKQYTSVETISMLDQTSIGSPLVAPAVPLEPVKGAFSSVKTLKSFSGPNIVSLGGYAFNHCSSLENINFPNLKNIGTGAFSTCTSLQSVNFPNIETVSSDSFRGCSALTDVGMANATRIEDYAFFGCTSLQSVNFPKATYVGTLALYMCNSLTDLNFPSLNYAGSGAFISNVKPRNLFLGTNTPPDISNFSNSSFSEAEFSNNWTYYYAGSPNNTAWNGFAFPSTNLMTTSYVALKSSMVLDPISPSSATIRLGESQSFTTQLTSSLPSLGLMPSNFVQWSILESNTYSSIDANGNLVIDPFESNDTLTIQAQSIIGDQVLTDTVTVKVTGFVTGVSLNKNDLSLSVDQSEQLIATVLPSDAFYPAVAWQSSDPTIATVTNDGVVTAKKAGKVVITVKSINRGYTATCDVTVYPDEGASSSTSSTIEGSSGNVVDGYSRSPGQEFGNTTNFGNSSKNFSSNSTSSVSSENKNSEDQPRAINPQTGLEDTLFTGICTISIISLLVSGFCLFKKKNNK